MDRSFLIRGTWLLAVVLVACLRPAHSLEGAVCERSEQCGEDLVCDEAGICSLPPVASDSDGGAGTGDTGGSQSPDAGSPDGGSADASPFDAAAADAAAADGGADDAGPDDAGLHDAGLADAGASDAAGNDAAFGGEDAGGADAAVEDAGSVDAGDGDAGISDAGDGTSCAGNLVIEPGFETGLAPWFGYRGSLTRVAQGHSGAYAARACKTDPGASYYTVNDTGAVLRPPKGAVYRVEFWVRSDSGVSQQVKATLREQKASGGFVGDSNPSTNPVAVDPLWQLISASYEVQSVDAPALEVFIASVTSTLGACIDIDDVCLVRVR